jgi:hypothetical protein
MPPCRLLKALASTLQNLLLPQLQRREGHHLPSRAESIVKKYKLFSLQEETSQIQLLEKIFQNGSGKHCESKGASDTKLIWILWYAVGQDQASYGNSKNVNLELKELIVYRILVERFARTRNQFAKCLLHSMKNYTEKKVIYVGANALASPR